MLTQHTEQKIAYDFDSALIIYLFYYIFLLMDGIPYANIYECIMKTYFIFLFENISRSKGMVNTFFHYN